MFARLKGDASHCCNQQKCVFPHLRYLKTEETGGQHHLLLLLLFRCRLPPTEKGETVKRGAKTGPRPLFVKLFTSQNPLFSFSCHIFVCALMMLTFLFLQSDCGCTVGLRLWPWRFHLHLLMKISQLLVSSR